MNWVPNPLTKASPEKPWFYDDQGHSQGPCSADEMLGLFQEGVIQDDTLIWQSDLPFWIPVSVCQAPWFKIRFSHITTDPSVAYPPIAPLEALPLIPQRSSSKHETCLKPQAPSQFQAPDQKASLLRKLFGHQ